MKKRLLALFAACSMITTAVAGMVQTAYAEGMDVTIVVSDVEGSDTQKVLTFYYGEDVEGMKSFEGYLSFTGGDVTINNIDITIPNDYPAKNVSTGLIGFSVFNTWEGNTTEDRSFATATITVPSDADITATFEIASYVVYDSGEDDEIDVEDCEDVIVVIPKKAVTPPVPVVDKEVVAAQAFTTPDYDKDMVVGIFDLNVTGANYDLSGVTYNGKPGAVTGETSVFGEVRITVIINGATSTDELNQIAFE